MEKNKLDILYNCQCCIIEVVGKQQQMYHRAFCENYSFLFRSLIQQHVMNVNDIKVSPYFSNSKNAKIECDSNRATRKEDTVMLPNKVRMNQTKTKLVELDPTENASKKLKSESLLLDLDPVKSEPIQPENWDTVLENIRTMRLNRDAPVDYLGAELCANKDCPPKVKLQHMYQH